MFNLLILTGSGEQLIFKAVHQYWEDNVFKCALGTTDAAGRVLSAGELYIAACDCGVTFLFDT